MENQVQHNKLPNATAALILGICAIVLCWCYGLGAVLGIIALVISKDGWRMGKADPTAYADFGNMKTGRLLAKIGIALSVLYLLFVIGMLIAMGGVEGYMEWIQEQTGQSF